MSFKIEFGFFNFDCTDYHAILGVPVNIDPKDIRKQYLKVARRLHPDSFTTENEEDRKRAAEYLSKLVNPAYEKLSSEKNYADHKIFLRLKAEQAARQQETVMLVSDSARRLAGATGDIEQPYRMALKELAEKQYEDLSRTLELTGQISELNLIYLMRTAGKEQPIKPPSGDKNDGSRPPRPPGPPGPPPPKPQDTLEQIVKRYLVRAKEFQNKGDSQGAIKEIRDALKLAPNSSDCHTLAGEVYLQLKQNTMAKIHFNQALKVNPDNVAALEGLRQIDPTATAPGKTSESAKGTKLNAKGSKPDSSGGGLFGLFGGKKK